MKKQLIITCVCVCLAASTTNDVFSQQTQRLTAKMFGQKTVSALPPSDAVHAGISPWNPEPPDSVRRDQSPFTSLIINPEIWTRGQRGNTATPVEDQSQSATVPQELSQPYSLVTQTSPENMMPPASTSPYRLAGPGHSILPRMIILQLIEPIQLPSSNAVSVYEQTQSQVYLQPQDVPGFPQQFMQSQSGHEQYSGNPESYSAGSCDDTGSSCGVAATRYWIPNELLPMMKNQQRGGLRSSFGGELRYRFMNESNRLRPPGPGTTSYNLWRFTPYISITAAERVTFFTQGIDASAFGYDAPYSPVGIDVNRSDLLRAYAEVKVTENLSYRYGRQFLNYGSQRLLSPLAWGNTYRNFEGHKVRFEGDDWDVDLFAMKSVNATAGTVFRPTSFDVADPDQQMSGVYSSYKGLENNTVDLYWLWLENKNDAPTRQNGNRHTLGIRWAGKQPVGNGQQANGTWAWDLEGAYQFGKDDFGTATDLNVNAGFMAMEGGYTANASPWSPSLTSIFYWGSGDKDPNDGQNNTVSTLYPLGHSYWGLIDNLNGQNLVDYGIRSAVRPTDRLTFSTTLHWFDRASSNDSVYNISGASFATGVPGQNIGTETDFVGTWDVSKAFQVQVGYSWFGYGAAIDNSSPRDDAEQSWVMTSLQF